MEQTTATKEMSVNDGGSEWTHMPTVPDIGVERTLKAVKFSFNMCANNNNRVNKDVRRPPGL